MTDTFPLSLRAGVHGCVAATVEPFGDRLAVGCRVDGARRRGALSADDGKTLAVAAGLALHNRLPLVIFLTSSGSDVHDGIDALHGWGHAARALVRASGIVPLLMAVHGPVVAGPALLLGLVDAVVMTTDAYAFVSGPHMVQQFTGVPMDNDELGGSGAHARHTGVAVAVVPTMDDATDFLTDLVSFLPAHTDEQAPRNPTDDPLDRLTPEAGDRLPATPTGSYDVRDVISDVVDDGEHLELRARWAGNIVTTLASIGGHSVGIVANQPTAIAGTLDIPSSQKGARFVAFCDAFNLPLITFVDTPGFYPGKDLEWRGMIRHGAQLAFAYARATVPRISVTLRKSYGGAYIVMDSKRMGNDLSLAWPSAEIAVMGAKGAAEILHRRASAAEKLEHERIYEERLLNPYVAAERGYVDAVIDPADTRRKLTAALDALESKRERLVERPHDNTPL